MGKISSGIEDFDRLLNSLYEGDNVVWEVEAGTSVELFIHNFVRQSLKDGKDIIYICFNRSPQSILKQFSDVSNYEKFIFLDAFTSGKGKNDRTFLRFYETRSSKLPTVIKVEKPADISSFTDILNAIQDKVSPGARYVFDSITGMQDLWDDEHGTYKFFTYMCPRLYDLETVAYWILEKDAHTQAFKANLRHITQVVVDLSKRGEDLFLKTLKLDNRPSREAFKTHTYEIDEDEITIRPPKKEVPFNLGPKLKEYRTKRGLNQKELADMIGLTPSFISQMENNQISPSLNSFMHICNALGISPVTVWQETLAKDTHWLILKEQIYADLERREEGIRIFTVVHGQKLSSYVALISPHAEIDGHFLYHKGEELIHIVKGSVSVVIEGYEKELNSGDTIFLTDSFPSEWKNKGDEEVELFITCS